MGCPPNYGEHDAADPRCAMSQIEVDSLAPCQLAAQQAADPELATIYSWKMVALQAGHDDAPAWSDVEDQDAATKEYWTRWSLLTLRDGVLFRKWVSAAAVVELLQLLVLLTLRDDVVRRCHDGYTGGDFGITKTQDQVARRAYWHRWRKTVRRLVRQCSECARYHRGTPPKQGRLQPSVTGSPWQRISIDLTRPIRRIGILARVTF